MANLNDLELLESNNFIDILVANGTSPSLRLLREQKDMAGMLGEVGVKILHDLADTTTDLGKSFARLELIEAAVRKTMGAVGMTTDMATKAKDIFNRSPNTLDELSDPERSAVQDYWIKKKTAIAELTKQGFTFQELFS
jgi:hypothetical protein